MKLYRTEHEVIISASVIELASISKKISAVLPGTSLNIPAIDNDIDTKAKPGHELAVRVTEGKFRASWNDQVFVVTGGKEQLQGFAEALLFNADTPVGCHTHWEHYAWSDGIESSSIPIVIQVA